MSASDGFLLLSAIYLSHEIGSGLRIGLGLACMAGGFIFMVIAK